MTILTPDQEQFWQDYLATLAPDDPRRRARVSADLAGSPDITDRLIDLYLAGRKTAGSGLVEDYRASGDPLPEVGSHWIALGADGRPRCILRTVGVETHPWPDVPERIAVAEGEGDLSLGYWRREHAAFYGPYLAEWGLASIEDATVVTEFFELVYAPVDGVSG